MYISAKKVFHTWYTGFHGDLTYWWNLARDPADSVSRLVGKGTISIRAFRVICFYHGFVRSTWTLGRTGSYFASWYRSALCYGLGFWFLQTFRRVAEVSQRGMSKEGRQRGSLNQPPVSYAHNLSKRISANKKIGRETTERTLLQHHNNVVHMYRCEISWNKLWGERLFIWH